MWGAIHGGMLAFERAQGKHSAVPAPAAVRSGSAITFFVVCLAWVFFRAKTLGQAVVYLQVAVRLRRRDRRRRTRPPGRCTRATTCTMFVLAALLVWRRRTPGRSRPGSPRRARVAALGAAGAVDPDDVDAERQPVPLLPILMDAHGLDADVAIAPRHGGPTDPSHDDDLRRGILRTAISRARPGRWCCRSCCSMYAIPMARSCREAPGATRTRLALDCSGARRARRTSANSRTTSTKRRPRGSICAALMQAVADAFRAATATARRRSARAAGCTTRPGVTALGGPPFLDPARLRSRRDGARGERPAVSPDPRPAVLELRALPRRARDPLCCSPCPTRQPAAARAARPGAGGESAPVAHNRAGMRSRAGCARGRDRVRSGPGALTPGSRRAS